MLKMTDIHKSFGELEVLKGIDLSVAKGDVLAIIGPSGSGKSTMLRCINRLEEIDSGKIEIMGRALAETGLMAGQNMWMRPSPGRFWLVQAWYFSSLIFFLI